MRGAQIIPGQANSLLDFVTPLCFLNSMDCNQPGVPPDTVKVDSSEADSAPIDSQINFQRVITG